MKRFALSTVLLVAITSLWAATTANVTGTWTGDMTEESGGRAQLEFQLKQTGDQVTGTAGPKGGPTSSIYAASMQGDRLRFSVGRDPDPVWKFDLTVSDKQMHGKGEGTRSGTSLGTTKVEMSLQSAQ